MGEWRMRVRDGEGVENESEEWGSGESEEWGSGE